MVIAHLVMRSITMTGEATLRCSHPRNTELHARYWPNLARGQVRPKVVTCQVRSGVR